jgi:regulatory protein YycH of two-component signal transduction system YycFG
MQFDVATVLLIATIVVIVLYLTWEIWAGHPFAD